MEHLSLKKLSEVMEQIEKYNIDFRHYLGCLKIVGESIAETSKKVSKVANIDLIKKRNFIMMNHISKLIKRARFVNKDMTVSLETELSNLKKIITYLESQKDNFAGIVQNLSNPSTDDEKTFNMKYGLQLISGINKVNNNVAICKDYILPKYENIAKECKLIQEKLDVEFNSLPKELAVDPDYDFKF